MKWISFANKYENGPKEIDEDSINNRIIIDGLLYSNSSLPKYSKELHDEMFELKIIENLRIIVLLKYELKLFVVYYLLDLSNVWLEIDVL